MKLKALVIVLDIVLIIFFISIFILPVFTGVMNMKTFWLTYWFFPPIFILLLAFINILYFKNKNIIECVESSDWTALCLNLENEVFDKRNLSFRNVKLLSQVQLLLSDFKGLQRLETFVRSNKGEYLSRLAANFAGGKLLSGQYEDLHTFASNLVQSGKKDEWIVFYVAFSLQMQKDYAKASVEFEKVLHSFNEAILQLMTAYFYYEVLKNYSKLSFSERNLATSAFKDTFRKSFNRRTWKAYTAKKKEDIHILVFKKVIDDATEWVFTD